MWTFERIEKEIVVGKPLIYLNDGRWWCAYRPADGYSIIYSIGFRKKSLAEKWGETRVDEWTKELKLQEDMK